MEEDNRSRWTEGITKETKLIALIALILLLAAGGILFYVISAPSTSSQQTLQSTQITTTGNASTTADTAKYLGYIPSGYSITPHEPGAPVFPCPSGMNSTQCSQFQQTCGNGVCDPNERCDTCPIDCAVSGALVCDPYTGRPSAPASVCQITPQQPVTQTTK